VQRDIHPTPLKASCSSCTLRDSFCLQSEVEPDDFSRIEALVSSHRKVRRGEHLYRTDDPFTAIYAVHSGFFKTDVLVADGRDQVTGFHMPGELLGFDGIGTDFHTCNALALEDSEVCVIPFDKLQALAREIPELQAHFHRVMSREIVRDHSVMLLLGTMRAEERLAAFLLNLSQRFLARGFSPAEFYLRMTRDEIGSYLGLKLETVSRAFSRFQDMGLLSVQQKHVRITDLNGLKNLLNPPERSAVA
jgi:CRP/FNR family transcriptional regulator